MVIYKKLLGKLGVFEDLKELDPVSKSFEFFSYFIEGFFSDFVFEPEAAAGLRGRRFRRSFRLHVSCYEHGLLWRAVGV